MLIYRKAIPTDADLLTQTAFRSKQVWGYPDEWMETWRDDLRVDETYILHNEVRKVFDDERFIGFFAFIRETDGVAVIDHFWLLPDERRKGYGKHIFAYLLRCLATQGYSRADVVAEPHAKGFYEKMGGRFTGCFESKIPGRMLDIYTFTVPSDNGLSV